MKNRMFGSTGMIVHRALFIALVVVSGCDVPTDGGSRNPDGATLADFSFVAAQGGDLGAVNSGSDMAAGGPGSGGAGGGGSGGGGSGGAGGGGSGGGGGGPLTCSAPVTYNHNGGSCGSERWSVKTGTDANIAKVNLVPQPTTIAALTAIPRPSNPPANGRVAPTETTVWKLTNVKLSVVKSESDSDYHLVVVDGSATMIVEVPYPPCVDVSSPFGCFVTHARHIADTITAGSTVTIVGVGFFDFNHGQTGEAPNSIELHPVLGLCVGQDCTPN